MKLIEALQARYQRALRDARAAALSESIAAVEEWRERFTAEFKKQSKVRVDDRAFVAVLLSLARQQNALLAVSERSDFEAIRLPLRNLMALTEGGYWRLPRDINSAICHFDYATYTPVTPGPVMRVLLSARLIYRAWRQDV